MITVEGNISIFPTDASSHGVGKGAGQQVITPIQPETRRPSTVSLAFTFNQIKNRPPDSSTTRYARKHNHVVFLPQVFETAMYASPPGVSLVSSKPLLKLQRARVLPFFTL